MSEAKTPVSSPKLQPIIPQTPSPQKNVLPVSPSLKRTSSGTLVSPKTPLNDILLSPGRPDIDDVSPNRLYLSPVRRRNPEDSPSRKNKEELKELSANLKTRLNYAFVKLQKGLENKSLEELEKDLPRKTEISSNDDAHKELLKKLNALENKTLAPPAVTQPRNIPISKKLNINTNKNPEEEAILSLMSLSSPTKFQSFEKTHVSPTASSHSLQKIVNEKRHFDDDETDVETDEE